MNPVRALLLSVLLVVAGLSAGTGDAVWQWSAPLGDGRAFLWIPADCARVRGLVLAQHNMIEQGILEHPAMRRTLADLGFAAVFVAPPFDRPFDFAAGAGTRLQAALETLAADSGYDELATVPVAPLGHSACASFPWNFAGWAPERTLAVLSVKGDAPLTDLTGSGKPNPAWDGARLAGIPGLMVMSQQEWWEARLDPLRRFRAAHSDVPLAVLTDTGRGHFDAGDDLVAFLAQFLRQAAAARLGPDGALRAVDPRAGWLVERWHADKPRRFAPAPAADYTGPRDEAFWCLDAGMAHAIDAIHARGFGRPGQSVDFFAHGAPVPISTAHSGVELDFQPEADGLTFRLAAGFIRPLPPKPRVAARDKPPPPTTTEPVAAAAGEHATGPVRVRPIVGPVEVVGDDTFRVALNRTTSVPDARRLDIWLLAEHPGDARYQGAVQQALLRVPVAADGAPQAIDFPALPDMARGAPVPLAARSSADLPVQYYVREGPAFVRDGALVFTPLPPRAKRPVRVTVVAWQLGRLTAPRVAPAMPVERSFRFEP